MDRKVKPLNVVVNDVVPACVGWGWGCCSIDAADDDGGNTKDAGSEAADRVLLWGYRCCPTPAPGATPTIPFGMVEGSGDG